MDRPQRRTTKSDESVVREMREREFLHNYWMNPADENQPERYLAETRNGRTALLLEMCRDAGVKHHHRILEIGCNVGRNLNALWLDGYNSLAGIEINSDAVEKMFHFFPDLKPFTYIWNGSIEDYIRSVPQNDLILSMTVLMHLHPESEWVFEEMVGKTNRWIITFEDECDHNSERILSRNYKDIFENLGMKCIRTETKIPGMSAVYTARVFEK